MIYVFVVTVAAITFAIFAARLQRASLTKRLAVELTNCLSDVGKRQSDADLLRKTKAAVINFNRGHEVTVEELVFELVPLKSNQCDYLFHGYWCSELPGIGAIVSLDNSSSLRVEITEIFSRVEMQQQARVAGAGASEWLSNRLVRSLDGDCLNVSDENLLETLMVHKPMYVEFFHNGAMLFFAFSSIAQVPSIARQILWIRERLAAMDRPRFELCET